ncbi:glycoside hydrolase family 10 protein [Pollutibacter soli]|uniref:glycoside hydrolase family 10 protein n=1 Tax=Pollutibacter soli TaxID=3034157 RepID=UPI0030134E78
MLYRKPLLFLFLFLFVSCSFAIAQASPKREFRAVWIATVDNIDWPSKKGLSSAQQQQEFIRQLDLHEANGINAIIMQIRPAADAFFPSKIEPWSEWLTGTQGKAPSPYYDPLKFIIDEVHKRGMEFHAWCNPYRAVFSNNTSSLTANHITKRKPEWFINYGGQRFFDPGNKDVQLYVNQVVEDIVQRYDIDAIHFDDYFYPYRIPGKHFNDQKSFAKYGKGLSLEDWRRSNVDSVIRKLNATIKKVKPYCRFGISPFGVWRNIDRDSLGSATRAGQTNYDDLYADILLWLRNDWIDYVAPQLYWEFGHSAAAYEVLLKWWNDHSYGKDCYIGLGVYKANKLKAWRDPAVIPMQIKELRTMPNVHGMIFFSSTSFYGNPLGWNDSLRNNYFHYPALIGARRNPMIALPPVPEVSHITSGSTKISFRVSTAAADTGNVRLVAVYSVPEQSNDTSGSKLIAVYPFVQLRLIEINADSSQYQKFYVTFLNRLNEESTPSLALYSPRQTPAVAVLEEKKAKGKVKKRNKR